ncbi:hypothetical protein ACFLZZ_03955 [Nanoarchaeota archaeon]
MDKRSFEPRQNLTEDDIVQRIRPLSSMLQQEYLENLLQRLNLDSNLKIFSSRKLADLYARRGMYASAARIITNAAMAAPTFALKKDLCMEAGMMAIKAGNYLLADDSFRHAGEEAPLHEKEKIKREAQDLFMFEAEQLEKKGRIARAVQLYEKTLREDRTDESLKQIKEKLVVLYERLGKIDDSLRMRDSLR